MKKVKIFISLILTLTMLANTIITTACDRKYSREVAEDKWVSSDIDVSKSEGKYTVTLTGESNVFSNNIVNETVSVVQSGFEPDGPLSLRTDNNGGNKNKGAGYCKSFAYNKTDCSAKREHKYYSDLQHINSTMIDLKGNVASMLPYATGNHDRAHKGWLNEEHWIFRQSFTHEGVIYVKKHKD